VRKVAEEIKAMSDEALRRGLEEIKAEMKRKQEVKAPPSSYERLKTIILETLKMAGTPLTWSETREKSRLKQRVPNDKWVRMLERDTGLVREKTKEKGIVWRLEQ